VSWEEKEQKLKAYNERMDEAVMRREEQNFRSYSIYPILCTLKG
jgi:hypothetical protein